MHHCRSCKGRSCSPSRTASLRRKAAFNERSLRHVRRTPGFSSCAATNLARLCGEQGERQKGYELLAPVYGWFTEGFEAADLTEARALLDELS